MNINPDIFKAYDVRGVYPGEVNEEAARGIGAAFVAYLQAKRIAVGRDMRLSSPAIASAFVDGASAQGAEIVDYGMIPTDMLYFAVARDGHDGGVQVTASHNPKQYNGMKMVRQEAFPLSGEAGLLEIREMLQRNSVPPPAASRGQVTAKNVLEAYVEHVMSFIDPAVIRPFNVVLDAGSGMGGLVAPKLFERLPCRTTRLCFTIDGTFPTHEANPLIEENRRDIVERVVAEKADVGIAWDGDADRCFFIDGTGAFISGDFITALLAEAFLLKHPGATIIYDLRNAIFGGEVTGHYYFRDNFYADNGFIPALLILELMSKKGQSLHDLLKPLNAKYFISGEINTKLKSMADVPAKLDQIAAKYGDARQMHMDGLSVEYDDWHFNVRPSNTEPLLRLNLEATTPRVMEQKRDEVLALIRG
ncbi:MAG: phosphomannomutase/phosphoglucomutase [Acidobacteria bacterium]|nr:MAG: phosphomannomutase/phosphoglucomutase [Acidobacteriota bacterium]